MNELNLQNPDFRQRIDYVEINEKNIVAEFFVGVINPHYCFRIYSNASLLSDNQRWFTYFGDEIKTLYQLRKELNFRFNNRINV